MIMRRISLGLALAVMSFGAQAVIMLSPGDEIATSSDHTAFTTWGEVETGFSFDIDEDLDLLYKAEVGDKDEPETTEEGPFAAFYETKFGSDPLDPDWALIEWIGGEAIDCEGDDSCFLIVKDGEHEPAQYLFDISSWDGEMDIDLTDFWPYKGAISHVAIWGREGKVPEPSIIALFGLGLLGLGFVSRRKA